MSGKTTFFLSAACRFASVSASVKREEPPDEPCAPHFRLSGLSHEALCRLLELLKERIGSGRRDVTTSTCALFSKLLIEGMDRVSACEAEEARLREKQQEQGRKRRAAAKPSARGDAGQKKTRLTGPGRVKT